MNVKAAVFSCNFIAGISLIVALFLLSVYGWPGAAMGAVSAIFWFLLGRLFARNIKN